MINWCIEKPNQGEKIDPESAAMKDLEAYIYWSNYRLGPGPRASIDFSSKLTASAVTDLR